MFVVLEHPQGMGPAGHRIVWRPWFALRKQLQKLNLGDVVTPHLLLGLPRPTSAHVPGEPDSGPGVLADAQASPGLFWRRRWGEEFSVLHIKCSIFLFHVKKKRE